MNPRIEEDLFEPLFEPLNLSKGSGNASIKFIPGLSSYYKGKSLSRANWNTADKQLNDETGAFDGQLKTGIACDFNSTNGDYGAIPEVTISGNKLISWWADCDHASNSRNMVLGQEIGSSNFLWDNPSNYISIVQSGNQVTFNSFSTSGLSGLNCFAILIIGTSFQLFVNGQLVDTKVGVISDFVVDRISRNLELSKDSILNCIEVFSGWTEQPLDVSEFYNNPQGFFQRSKTSLRSYAFCENNFTQGTPIHDYSENKAHGYFNTSFATPASYNAAIYGIAEGLQLGLINYNSSLNLFDNSEDFTSSSWGNIGVNSISTPNHPDPIGGNNASLISFDINAMDDLDRLVHQLPTELEANKTYTWQVWAKGVVGGEVLRMAGFVLNDQTKIEDKILTTEWQQFSLTIVVGANPGATRNFQIRSGSNAAQSFYIWGASVSESESIFPYIPTNGTSIDQSINIAGQDQNGLDILRNALPVHVDGILSNQNNEGLGDLGANDFYSTGESTVVLALNSSGSNLPIEVLFGNRVGQAGFTVFMDSSENLRVYFENEDDSFDNITINTAIDTKGWIVLIICQASDGTVNVYQKEKNGALSTQSLGVLKKYTTAQTNLSILDRTLEDQPFNGQIFQPSLFNRDISSKNTDLRDVTSIANELLAKLPA